MTHAIDFSRIDLPLKRATLRTCARGLSSDVVFPGALAPWFYEFAGVSPSQIFSIGWTTRFGTGDKAGYLWAEGPVPVVVPGALPGDRIWVKMRAWEPSRLGHTMEVQLPDRFWGESATFSLIISNTPTPLIGLKSYGFQAAQLQISRQGGEVVLRWSAGDGTVYYNVETTSALGVPGSWRPSSRSPVMDRRSVPHGAGIWLYADWVMTNTVTEPAAFYRIILLNP